MTRLHLSILMTLLLSTTLLAQVDEPPLFGPPPAEPRPVTATESQDEPRPSREALLIERLSRWPEGPAYEAGRALILEGGRVVPLLLKSLQDNDWRIRSGVAWVLGELREQSAFPELRKGARDIANRISTRPFFDAMLKIDTVKATAEILEYISSADARVAKEAFDSLPSQIDAGFESRIIELAKNKDATVRQRALQLSRRSSRPVSTEMYFAALADPAPRVACEARDILSDREDQATLDRLRSIVLEGALRPASFAVLTLVKIEDRTNRVLLDESPEMKKRLLVLLNVRGELENAVGAIAFANISTRTADPEIRAFAGGPLMDILLGTAAGGIIFHDYIAVKTLAFRKVAEISGESFGEDSERWLAWWRENREGFHPRRELRKLESADIPGMLFRFSRRVGERSFSVVIRSGEPAGDRYQVIRPIYVDVDQMRRLADSLEDLGFFGRRGMQRDADWAGDFVDVSVTVDAAEFRRSHYGTALEDMVELETLIQQIAVEHRWQSFFGSRPASEFRSWFLEQRAELDRPMAADLRLSKIADLGLDCYAEAAPQARREALAAWRAAGDEYVANREARFLELLGSNDLRPARAGELLEILADRPGIEITEAVIESLPLFSPEGREAALRFLGRRPSTDLVALVTDGQPELGAVLLSALSARCDEPEVVTRITELLRSPDPRMQQAIRRAFPGGAPRPLLEALRASIDEAEPSRRLRLIEIWGAISPAAELEALEGWFATGSLAQKLAVVRAMAEKPSEVVVERLFDLAQNSESHEICIEALGRIATSENPLVRQRMRRALKEIEDESRLLEFFQAAGELFRAEAEVELGGFLADERPGIRRQAAVMLAPRLVPRCIPELLDMLLDKTQASRAWEFLEVITCQEIAAISAGEAYVTFDAFWNEHKGEDQTRWFMTALDKQGMPSSNLLGYLNGNDRDLRSIALLLKSLDSDKWFLRVNAHFHLGQIRGEPLGNLSRSSTPEEITRVRNRWDEWYKAILAGL